jgi:hypothetical protein
MSVIGRLDDQVNRVLIAPLDKNRQSKTDEREAALDEQAAAPHAVQPTPEENESSHKERAAPEELPVWLL